VRSHNIRAVRFIEVVAIATALIAVAGCTGGSPPVAPISAMQQHDGSPLATLKALYSFKGGAKNGAYPGGLIALNSVLYGTTSQGGNGVCNYVNGCGTVYTIDQSGQEKMLYAFQGLPNDGWGPSALIELNGMLYGITSVGGNGGCKNAANELVGCGTVFSMTTSGQEKVLYNFQGGHEDGAYPTALTVVNGVLYGTTKQGGGAGCGGFGCGTVFSLTTSGPARVLYSFTDTSVGAYPSALIHVKSKLFGTTVIGGGYCYSNGQGCGTVFSLTTSGVEKTLYRFSGKTDGAAPEGHLVYLKGTLYGATSSGGFTYCYDSYEGGCGTIYSLTTSGQEQVLHRFSGVYSDGALPYGGVIAWKGVLYGTTLEGGNARTGGYCDNGHFMTVGCGTVFAVTTSGQETMLYSFSGGSNGGSPLGNLVALNGALYGTTSVGGRWNLGKIFRLRP
jgi:uncharacterized repeat protein (TIGR03803 family)